MPRSIPVPTQSHMLYSIRRQPERIQSHEKEDVLGSRVRHEVLADKVVEAPVAPLPSRYSKR